MKAGPLHCALEGGPQVSIDRVRPISTWRSSRVFSSYHYTRNDGIPRCGSASISRSITSSAVGCRGMQFGGKCDMCGPPRLYATKEKAEAKEPRATIYPESHSAYSTYQPTEIEYKSPTPTWWQRLCDYLTENPTSH